MGRMKTEDARKKITFRVSADKWEQFDKMAENGEIESKSAAMRDKLAELLDDDEGDEFTPDEEKLARAYRALVEHASATDEGGLVIPTDEAKSLVSQRTGTKKGTVRRLVFSPLERGGYIAPKWGRMEVKPLDVPTEGDV